MGSRWPSTKRFSPDQPRDDGGKFASGAAGEDAKEAEHGIKAGDKVESGGKTYTVSHVAGNTLTAHEGTSSKPVSLHATKVTKRFSPDQPRDDHGRFGEGNSNKEAVHDHAEATHNTAAQMHKDAADKMASNFDMKGAAAHLEAAKAHEDAAAAHAKAGAAASSGSGYKAAAQAAHDSTAKAYTATGKAEGRAY